MIILNLLYEMATKTGKNQENVNVLLWSLFRPYSDIHFKNKVPDLPNTKKSFEHVV